MGFVRAEDLRRPVLYGVGVGLLLASGTLASVFASAGAGDAPLILKYLPAVFSFVAVVLLFLGRPVSSALRH